MRGTNAKEAKVLLDVRTALYCTVLYCTILYCTVPTYSSLFDTFQRPALFWFISVLLHFCPVLLLLSPFLSNPFLLHRIFFWSDTYDCPIAIFNFSPSYLSGVFLLFCSYLINPRSIPVHYIILKSCSSSHHSIYATTPIPTSTLHHTTPLHTTLHYMTGLQSQDNSDWLSWWSFHHCCQTSTLKPLFPESTVRSPLFI